MSDKQFEECSLEEATHVEVNGVRHELNDNVEYSYNGFGAGILWREEDTFIPEELFSTLGIKPLKEIKRDPIVFEGIVRKSIGLILFLGDVPEGTRVGTKFKCVEISEEIE